MTLFNILDPLGAVVLDDTTKVYTGGNSKKISTSALVSSASYNGILRSAYDNSLLARYPVIRHFGSNKGSFPSTQTGELYLWQPTDGNTIGINPGFNVTSGQFEEGCLAVPTIANAGNVYPIRLMAMQNHVSGYLDVMNESGSLIWSAASLMTSPSVIDIIEMPASDTLPFSSWNKYWEVPTDIDPNNIFFLNMSFMIWNLGEDSWEASWVNFTRVGRRYYYRGARNTDSATANISNSFGGSFLVYVFHVPNAT